jgi:gliding motility-associated-like protein
VTTPVKYCQGATASALVASGASGATIWWSSAMGGAESTTAPTPGTATVGTTRYYVRQQSSAGCYSQYAFIDVEIIAKPEPPVVRDTVYCFGVTAAPVSAVGNAIKWFDALTGGTKYATTPTPATTGTTISFYPSQTIDGCESDRSTLKVDIAQIKADFSIVKDSLCYTELMNVLNNSTYTLAGVAAPYNSMWWFGDGDTSTASVPSHSYTNLGLYTVKLKVSDVHKCMDSTTRKVYVAPKVVLDFTRSDSLICQGEAIDFAATLTPGYYQVVWDFDDGDVKTFDQLNVRQAFTSSGKHNVNFKASYSICGIIDVTHPVEITEVPKVNIGRDTTVCPGNTPLLLTNSTSSSSALRYLWNTGDTVSQIAVRNEGEYWLRVQERSCLATDSIKVSKGCFLNIPNAFKPNDADPYNQYFLPRDLMSKSVVGFEMKIFDRWGVQLFETSSLNGRGWDGTYKGEPQSFGVYVYQIKVAFSNGLTENYSGNLTLLR